MHMKMPQAKNSARHMNVGPEGRGGGAVPCWIGTECLYAGTSPFTSFHRPGSTIKLSHGAAARNPVTSGAIGIAGSLRTW